MSYKRHNLLCAGIMLFLFLPVLIMAEKPMTISYEISWKQSNTHYYLVSMTIENPGGNETRVRMPAWRPGRYLIQNFSRNVVDVQISNEQGLRQPVAKTDKDTWNIEHAGAKSIRVNYRYYANTLDAGSSYLSEDEAYINPINLLMYIPGQEMLPVQISLHQPESWKLATALEPVQEMDRLYSAASYHDLVDSPILISPTLQQLSFEILNTTIEVAIQGDHPFENSRIEHDLGRIIEEQAAIFGGLPFKRYLFLYHLVPGYFGHGVEHKNSTSIVLGPSTSNSALFYDRLLSFSSHEFFHVWNVERIRPASIYYPDYAVEGYTALMWFFEGITDYYDALTLTRAGLRTESSFILSLEQSINSYWANPGRHVTSVAESSWDTWLQDGPSPPNTRVSVYRKGALIGLILDLAIRDKTRNLRSLDDVMRYLYQEYAEKNRGVPEDGILKALETVSGEPFQGLYDELVNGTGALPFKAYLNVAGFSLQEVEDPGQPAAYLGLLTRSEDGETSIRSILPDSPAEKAGLDTGDILVAIDGRRANAATLDEILFDLVPGKRITITVFRNDRLREFKLLLEGGKNVRYEISGHSNPDEEQLIIRNSWLASGKRSAG